MLSSTVRCALFKSSTANSEDRYFLPCPNCRYLLLNAVGRSVLIVSESQTVYRCVSILLLFCTKSTRGQVFSDDWKNSLNKIYPIVWVKIAVICISQICLSKSFCVIQEICSVSIFSVLFIKMLSYAYDVLCSS